MIKKIEGTVRSLTSGHRQKKDEDFLFGTVVIANDFGDRITLNGSPDLLDGLRPEEEIIIEIRSAQKTIEESITNGSDS